MPPGRWMPPALQPLDLFTTPPHGSDVRRWHPASLVAAAAAEYPAGLNIDGRNVKEVLVGRVAQRTASVNKLHVSRPDIFPAIYLLRIFNSLSSNDNSAWH